MCYVREALDNLGIKLPILKLGATYPVPEKNIEDFIKDKDEVLVVDELEPMVENDVRAIAGKVNCKLKITGKELIPRSGELRPEMVEKALAKLLKKSERLNLDDHLKKFKDLDIIRRYPVMCPGCPHRATFFSVKKVAPKDTVFGGDIGCYMLGAFPPYNMADFMYDMGANIGIIHGIRKAADYFGTEKAKNNKTISFIGDGTFFHAGIAGLLNTVYNNSNSLIVIMDNRITAMTGHQPNPGMGKNGMREEVSEVNVEEIVRACGIKHMKVVSTYNLKETQTAVKELLEVKGPSVLVAKGPCILLRWSEMRKSGQKIIPFEIDQEKCKKCGTCVSQYACPAIQHEGDKYFIDKELCSGCGACSQVCPFGAIKLSK
jgi:indolepyruvate ferredoxin oxidoreductase alpha subunit